MCRRRQRDKISHFPYVALWTSPASQSTEFGSIRTEYGTEPKSGLPLYSVQPIRNRRYNKHPGVESYGKWTLKSGGWEWGVPPAQFYWNSMCFCTLKSILKLISVSKGLILKSGFIEGCKAYSQYGNFVVNSVRFRSTTRFARPK